MAAGRIHVRELRREEVPVVVDLLADDRLGQGREDVAGEISQSYFEAYDALDANNRVLVAELGGEIVGTFQLSFIVGLSRRGAKRAQIEAVRVSADRRGMGIGEEMIRQAVEMARNEGCGLVQLTTDKKRSDAVRFYERLGFVASHEGMKLDLNH